MKPTLLRLLGRNALIVAWGNKRKSSNAPSKIATYIHSALVRIHSVPSESSRKNKKQLFALAWKTLVKTKEKRNEIFLV